MKLYCIHCNRNWNLCLLELDLALALTKKMLSDDGSIRLKSDNSRQRIILETICFDSNLSRYGGAGRKYTLRVKRLEDFLEKINKEDKVIINKYHKTFKYMVYYSGWKPHEIPIIASILQREGETNA